MENDSLDSAPSSLLNRAENYYQLSADYYQQGDLTNAIAAIHTAIKCHPNFAAAYQLLAEIFTKLGKTEAADRAQQKATTLLSVPTPDAYNQEIATLVEQGKLNEAIASCQNLLTHYPNYAPGYLNWGIVLKKQGNLEPAIAAFQQALQIQPDFALAHANVALVLEEQQCFTEAIAHYYRAIEIEPNFIEIYANLSNSLAQIGRVDTAIQVLQQSLKIDPNQATVYFNLGNLFAEIGERAQAIASLQTAWKLNPDFADAGYNLSLIFKQQGNLEAAIAILQTIISQHPNFIAAYLTLGYLLEKDERLEPAIALYQKAIERNPESADAYKALAVALEQQGKFDQAYHYYQKSLILQPDIFLEDLETVPEKEKAIANSLTQNLDNFHQVICLSSPSLAKSINSNSAQNKIIYQPIHPASQISFNTPLSLNQGIHKNLQLQQLNSPESFVLFLEKGKAWANYYSSYVTSAEHQLLADVSTGQPLLCFQTQRNQSIEKFPGTVAFLSLLGGATYYHWMVDILPKFELIRQSGLDWNTIDYFIVNYYQKSFQQESLQALGIPETKLLSSHQHPSIQAETLIVPSVPSSIPPWVENATPGVPQWVCQFLRNTFLKENYHKKFSGGERVYISRDRAQFRRIVNEDEVVHLLENFGFKTVFLESLSVAEQAALMAQVKVIIAPHGAGLTNLVFCSPKTKIIEIFSPRYVPNCYWVMSQQMQLGYYYLVGENLADYYTKTQRSRPEPIHIHGRVQDIWVNVDLLWKMLQCAGVLE